MSCLGQSLEGTVKRGAAAGVLLFADAWACTHRSQIPETDFDRWFRESSSSGSRIDTLEAMALEEIGPLLFLCMERMSRLKSSDA
jgi:hypothetical protein